MPAAGTTALYRPVPHDFDEVFARIGWTSIEAHYRVHWRTVTKWLNLRNGERAKMGLEKLQVERDRFVRRYGAAKSPARQDYVLRTVRKRQRSRDAVSAVTDAAAPE